MREVFKSISVFLIYSHLHYYINKVRRNHSLISQILLISFLFNFSHIVAVSPSISPYYFLFTHGTLSWLGGLTHFVKFREFRDLFEGSSFFKYRIHIT